MQVARGWMTVTIVPEFHIKNAGWWAIASDRIMFTKKIVMSKETITNLSGVKANIEASDTR